MSIKIAINGYGRIGRNILRAFYESAHQHDLSIVAINDLSGVETSAHLTEYDSTHGRFQGDIAVEKEAMVVNGDKILFYAERDPAQLPWESLGIDIVFECTGFFASRAKSEVHLAAGAKHVLISAPAGKEVDATVVYGINHQQLSRDDKIISNASCTTNCLTPLVKPLHDAIGIECGLMSTIHAYTNDQKLVDSVHSDLRRARSATQSMIPTKTGAASAVGLVLPELAGKLDGFAVRVPTVNVSFVDLTFQAKAATTVDAVNTILTQAAEGPLQGILAVNTKPLVSCDFNHNPASSIFDATQTKVIDRLVKVCAWYDNEWGFSNRMLDVAHAWLSA